MYLYSKIHFNCILSERSRSDHISDALISLHCLRVPERITRLPSWPTVLWPSTYHSRPTCSHQSESLTCLLVIDSGPLLPTTWSFRLSDWAPSALALFRYSYSPHLEHATTVPLHVSSTSSLTVFKQHLKFHLYCFSFPGLSPVWLLSGPCWVCCHSGHLLIDWLVDLYHIKTAVKVKNTLYGHTWLHEVGVRCIQCPLSLADLKARLMLTRLEFSQGHQTWYHSIC